ncbi:SRPBCC family protein [Aeromicrobium chenweiae]|uniref:Dimethyladenosine transferase n=1 Tax=Aeromicrobium chenweiae TaxID=2079793 RepID=A0A2S0WIA0_9ACTN|nr:SRPBCC family protein [Aeromicrobium chenweiae]AWB91071.1 dimethyladenosine transferase [Aeromicrobium chenweiae]TGN31974.1 dimethyladenosine transferase [Aeromicrobium chenweiae]
MTSDTITVQRTILAPADRIFALLSDAARHSELDGSGTVRGTREASQPLELGSKFGMAMHMGIGYRTMNEVVEFEPDRRIAWRTTGAKGLIGGRVWRYELEPVGGGTLVKETWDVSKDRQRFFLKRSPMAPAAKVGMRRTLDRIASLLEE